MKRIRIGLALAGSLVLLTGCGSVVTGTPRAEGSYGGSDSQEFANVLQECEAVTDEQIAGAVGADAVGRGFFGAICRWDGIGAAGPIKITFNWFETGTLDHERAAFEHLGYVVAKIDNHRQWRVPGSPAGRSAELRGERERTGRGECSVGGSPSRRAARIRAKLRQSSAR